MDLNPLFKCFKCFMSKLLAIVLVHEWKIWLSVLLLLSKTNTVWTLNFFNLFNNPFNLFLISGLVLINCNSGGKKFKILAL